MSDRTLCSEKELKEEDNTAPARSTKRRNAIFMGES